MNVLLAILLLVYLVAFCVYIVADVDRLCEEQTERRHTGEAVSAIGRAE